MDPLIHQLLFFYSFIQVYGSIIHVCVYIKSQLVPGQFFGFIYKFKRGGITRMSKIIAVEHC